MSDSIDRLAYDADQLAAERRRVPLATYRLQMHTGFSIRDAVAITDYLQLLGISHVYTSSILAAKPGSTHGYDVIDHGRLNPEIGTEDELNAWIAGLRERGMGWVLDVVPNHMSIGGSNEWWLDVLEHGPASPYSGYFDIAWNDHPRERLHGKVLLPILGSPYGAEIEAGRFRVRFVDASLFIAYGEMRLPVDPRTYGMILGPALESVREELGAENADVNEFQSILTSVKNLPPRTDAARSAEGWSECRVIKRRLAELVGRDAVIEKHIGECVDRLNGTPGDPASYAALEELLDAQAYRPCFWRVASDEINYRRFFDVNDLAALSTEREDVFVAVHRKIFEWIQKGLLDGLRIDHPDGLYDPKQYLERLQLADRLANARHLLESQPQNYEGLDWASAEPALRERFDPLAAKPLYVVVEKILAGAEQLPPTWPTDGTTGYEFINLLNGLFVAPAGEQAMTRIYHEFTGFDERLDQLVYSSKFQLLQTTLASELHMLAYQLDRLAQSARWSRDFTLNGLRHALREVIACFPVYRSYVNGGLDEQDRSVILRAIVRARRRNPLLGAAIFNFIRDTLLLKDPPSGLATPEYRTLQSRFTGKFQQVTAPAMAKGFEDTALYVHSRLLSLNEVGGEPDKFGRPPAEVHRALADRAAKYPTALSPLSTHDTKRSEDVRARINVLSELPAEWADRVRAWAKFNQPHKIDLGDGQVALDANEEYFLYQTLIGIWPVEGLTVDNRTHFVRRIQAYLNKALHEAKVHTSWVNPNAEYDAAASEFVSRILDLEKSKAFLDEFEAFQAKISLQGMLNSLSQTLLRATAPGVPDTYQGTELWDLSLVDPDNRRPVDYRRRFDLLLELDRRGAEDQLALVRNLVQDLPDGRIKLYVLSRALRFRRAHSNLFSSGTYVPIEAFGSEHEHVFSYLTRGNEDRALVVVPRLTYRWGALPVSQSWKDTYLQLPEAHVGRWRNVLTGELMDSTPDGKLALSQVLNVFPLALLEPASR
jgi:(1->4)-alpha-D-glucan 1-alpha-D-glucosylmutase